MSTSAVPRAAPLPVIDISPFFGIDISAQDLIVEQVRGACLRNGFFQIINHGISDVLQKSVFEQSRDLFNLSIDEKVKYHKGSVFPHQNPYGRGYEHLRAQNFEKKTEGDLKEGYYLGRDAEPNHYSDALQKYLTGPNLYLDLVSDPVQFRTTMDQYHKELTRLSELLLKILARTLSLPESWFDGFVKEPIATLRLLHYPPQPSDASADERGIGAHTDFGGITILMQDAVGGLEVYDRPTESWIAVQPTPGAFVVNLGNLMMRWTNDRYISNLHRVINKSGRERYSVPFFFSGNPDYMVECIPECADDARGAKYEPVRVKDWMAGRFIDTYGGSGAGATTDLAGLKEAV